MRTGLISREAAALVVIDVQEKLFAHVAEKEKLTENLTKLIQFARIVKIPVILTEQYPKGLGQTILQIKALAPDLKPVEKLEFNCFGSNEFRETFATTQIRTLILTGIEAHICVAQTAIEGLEKGFRTCVVEDAISSRRLEDKANAVQRMRQNGVTVVSTEMLIYELLGKAGTPEFRETLKLVK
jgi:nicotinamidase-related amidase